MYWRQWRIVPPSLVTVQDVWWLVSVRVHYLGESTIFRVDIFAVAVAVFALGWAKKKQKENQKKMNNLACL